MPSIVTRLVRSFRMLCVACVILAPSGLFANVTAATPFTTEEAALDYATAHLAMALDAEGDPRIAYVANVTGFGFVMYAERTPLGWIREQLDPATTTSTAGSLSIAIDGNGISHVSYYDSVNQDLKHAKRIAGAWITETVASSNDVGLYSSIRVLADVNLQVLYYSTTANAMLTAYSTTPGVWTGGSVGNTGGLGRNCQLVVDSARQTRAASVTATGTIYYTMPTTNGWFDEIVGTSASGTDIGLDLDDRGNPYIAYCDPNLPGVKLARRTGLAVWTSEVVETNVSGYSFGISLVIDAGGNPCVSYLNPDGLLRFARKDGATWQTETVDPYSVNDTAVAIDPHGNPVIAFSAGQGGRLRLADSSIRLLSPVGGELWATGSQQSIRWRGAGSVDVQLSSDGGHSYSTLVSGVTANEIPLFIPPLSSSSARLRITRSSPFSRSETRSHLAIAPDLVSPWWTSTAAALAGSYASLALDQDGVPHIAYYTSTSHDLVYVGRRDNQWSSETVASTGDIGRYASLKLDPSGTAFIAYQDVSNGDLRCANKSGGLWTSELVHASGVTGLYCSLAIDPSGNPSIAFFDQDSQKLRYAYRNAGVWSEIGIDSGTNVGIYASLALDAAGHPHISYQDGGAQDLKYASDTDGDLSFTIETVESTGNSGAGSSIAVDPSGNPCIVYQDGTSGRLKFARRLAGVWQIEAVGADRPSAVYTSTDLALTLASDGTPMIVFRSTSPQEELKIATKHGNSWSVETLASDGAVYVSPSPVIDSQGRVRAAYVDDTNHILRYASTAVELSAPGGDITWPVGASTTVRWDGTGRADLSLSLDGGNSWQPLATDVGGGSYRLTVPHTPTRFARVRVDRAVPRSTSISPSFFSIESSIDLLGFRAEQHPGGGTLLLWSSDPGPENLAGYRVDRRDGSMWTTIVPLTRETRYVDANGSPGSVYRLTAVNGLGEEYLLGETGAPALAPLSAWPNPYRGGSLRVSFALFGQAGSATFDADVAVFDIAGRRVRTLATGRFHGPRQETVWDGRLENGEAAPAGVYFVRCTSGSVTNQEKVVVVR